MVWREWLVPSIAVVAILAGSWLLWRSLHAVDPLPPYGPPPVYRSFSVTPGYTFRPETPPVPTVVPITGTPKQWRWYTHTTGCHPALTLTMLCARPTPSATMLGR